MKGQGKRFIRGLARDRQLYPAWFCSRMPGRMVGGKPAKFAPTGSLRGTLVKINALSDVTMPQAAFKEPVSYEAALEELEQLVQHIESGQLPLEQLLTGYERGAELLTFCRSKLDAVENQIKVLDQGALKPWTQE